MYHQKTLLEYVWRRYQIVVLKLSDTKSPRLRAYLDLTRSKGINKHDQLDKSGPRSSSDAGDVQRGNAHQPTLIAVCP